MYKYYYLSTAIFFFNLNQCKLPEPYNSIKTLPLDLHGWFNASNQKMLAEFIKKIQPKIVIEVGSWLGKSSIYMAQLLNPSATLYAIDHWHGNKNNEKLSEAHKRLPTLFQQFLSNVIHMKLSEKIIPIRMSSLEAAKSLNIIADLIYIDACHDEESVYNDIIAWHAKLSKTGIICGDDYHALSVQQGVQRAAKILNKNIESVKPGFWYFK
jgi:predicted O-methyltransferase YrrM